MTADLVLEKVESFLNGLENMSDAPTKVRTGAAFMRQEVMAALNATPPAQGHVEMYDAAQPSALPEGDESAVDRLRAYLADRKGRPSIHSTLSLCRVYGPMLSDGVSLMDLLEADIIALLSPLAKEG